MTRVKAWLALLASLFACAAQAESHLVATLRDTTPPGVRDRVLITLALENTGDVPVHVFTPATPFIVPLGHLSNDLLDVTDAFGKRASFIGARAHFSSPGMKLFRLVAPGERLEQEFDLTEAYDFGHGGPYTVRYTLRMWHRPAAESVTSDEMAQFKASEQDVVLSDEITVFAPPGEGTGGRRGG
ncbi:hypothetical protein KPL74_18955 [Bacillus sp. NP157]|nr:hypothetical protein KPL74_18955 [Bacillus sp. NP157]